MKVCNKCGSIDIVEDGIKFPEKVPPIPEKKPELMTLADAMSKMSVGDVFKCEDDDEIIKDDLKVLRFRNSNIIAHMSDENFNKKGQIIPAQPRVWANGYEYVKIYECDEEERLDDFGARCFDKGDQNGQLKQWLNHKELREAVENIIKDYDSIGVCSSTAGQLKRAFENLKPLNDK